MQNKIKKLENKIEDLKNSHIKEIDDLNSLLNDINNEIINKRYIDEIRKSLKIIKIIPKNLIEKEALDTLKKILNNKN